jgi:phage-related protein
MSHPTLTLPAGLEPSAGSGSETATRLRKASFGDGYSQIAGDGINSVTDRVTLTIEQVPVAAADGVVATLKGWKGATTFWFTLPNETVARRWTCATWSRSWPEFGLVTLTMTLEESFAP